MIFVTIGTELPFDRLVRTVDQWASDEGISGIFAQIGKGGWEPKHMKYCNFLSPIEFDERFQSATLIISHAGMGTILSALYHGKPIITMPRRASFGEHRSEHQIATAKQMSERGSVNVASNEVELRKLLSNRDQLFKTRSISRFASDELISGLQRFISGVSS